MAGIRITAAKTEESPGMQDGLLAFLRIPLFMLIVLCNLFFYFLCGYGKVLLQFFLCVGFGKGNVSK